MADVLPVSEWWVHDDPLVAALHLHVEEVSGRDLAGVAAGADVLGTSGVEFDAVDNGTAGSCGLRDGAASGRRLQHLTTGFEFG
ncbi:hypothetical protein QBB31_14345 [Streptomyces scabiei]|uniref:hypothetical protein n=1 Tax=Streptomyces scabiei TaxID=1930 RepID=UPI002FF110E0